MDENVSELEMVQDEVFSKLARHYGLSKGEIARLALKRYGDGEMTERHEEVLSDLKTLLQSGGRGDPMDKMMMWEMIRDMRNQRNNPQPQPQYPQQPQQMQQPPERMNLQEMMAYPMMYMMFKTMMGGGDDDLMKLHRMRMIYGDGDSKKVDFERMEQLIREQQAYTDAKFEQFMNTILGKQEAEKLREREERYKKEMEERVRRAEYMAQHPIQPQDPYQSTKQRMDESLDMMDSMRQRMEASGMVQRPETVEDKVFTKDMTQLKHQQGIESKAVDKLADAADKLSTTVDSTTNKVIDLVAEEQKTRQRQIDMARSPEERERLQRQYETLGAQVMAEGGEDDYGGMEPEEGGEEEEFSDVDDLDATE